MEFDSSGSGSSFWRGIFPGGDSQAGESQVAPPHPRWNGGKGMDARLGSSWRCGTPWKGLGINPAGEIPGIPTLLPWWFLTSPLSLAGALQAVLEGWNSPRIQAGNPSRMWLQTPLAQDPLELWLWNSPAFGASKSTRAPARGNFSLPFQQISSTLLGFFSSLSPSSPGEILERPHP